VTTQYAVETADRAREVLTAERVEHARYEDEMPSIGPHGLLTYRARSICLSERNALIAGVFIYHFNSELTDLQLLDRVWPEGATHLTLRLCLRRLDRRVRRVGLTIIEVGEHAHEMRAVDDV
jgi:hypothetical protein